MLSSVTSFFQPLRWLFSSCPPVTTCCSSRFRVSSCRIVRLYHTVPRSSFLPSVARLYTFVILLSICIWALYLSFQFNDSQLCVGRLAIRLDDANATVAVILSVRPRYDAFISSLPTLSAQLLLPSEDRLCRYLEVVGRQQRFHSNYSLLDI